MKEKIIKILEEKAECTMNGHADFDNVDITQFEGIAEEIVKLCNLHFVTQRSELLLAFVNFHNERYPEKYIPNSEIGKFNLASNNA